MKILIADDHQLFLDGLEALINSRFKHKIIKVQSFQEATNLINDSFDLVISDLRMPGMRGIKKIEKLIEKYPLTPFIIISATESQLDIDAVINAGAMAFIPKTFDGQKILSIIAQVLEGERYHHKVARLTNDSLDHFDPVLSASFTGLSERQLQVLVALSTGKTNEQIAQSLTISANTVKTHVANLFRHFSANTRVECVQKARASGLI